MSELSRVGRGKGEAEHSRKLRRGALGQGQPLSRAARRGAGVT
ncbi:MAG: hypothetical protein AB3X44_17080 [Leptothrix sp. (in: b-proteobacteria)]